MQIDEYIQKKPYSTHQYQKEPLFLEVMKEALYWHSNNSSFFKRILLENKIIIDDISSLERIPLIPVTDFKKQNLVSVPEKEIRYVIYSSSTTSKNPSRIGVDEITIQRQKISLKNILSDFIGNNRYYFIVFDAKSSIQNRNKVTSSRESGLRGMALFSKSIKFLLNEKLELDKKLLRDCLSSLKPDDKVCFWGFTWMIYDLLLGINRNDESFSLFNDFIDKIENDKILLHVGGWKKLQSLNINKNQFNAKISSLLRCSKRNIMDIYGMTEQLGVIYPDCEFGYKHVPLYSEIIIREADSFNPLPIGKGGLIQILSPIPNSYPGVSILTQDEGVIVGIDNCSCRRKGKYFKFLKRKTSYK